MCAICELKIEFNIGHPRALSVAVATREAMDAGLLPETAQDGALSNMKLRMAAIEALKGLQNRLEHAMPISALMALPNFYVLLIEIGTWGFFRPTEAGFDSECTPEPPNVLAVDQTERDVVFVSSEAAMRAILDGTITIDAAFERNLIELDAGDEDTRSLRRAVDAAFSVEQNHAVKF